MKKNILISLDNSLITLSLVEKGRELDKLTWKDENNLSLNLLKRIDDILLKNKLKIEEIEKIEVDSLQTTYSATRIAKIVAKTTNYYLTNCQKSVK